MIKRIEGGQYERQDDSPNGDGYDEVCLMNPEDYVFAAKVSALDDRSTQAWVRLSIRLHDESATHWFTKIWDKMRQAAANYHETLPGAPSTPGWASWKPHEWCKKQVANRQKYVAWSGDAVAGFLYLMPSFASPIVDGRKVMYVEIVATAPGNLVTDIWGKQLSYVGRALMAYAVLESQRQGFDGMLGLHVADDEALEYYRHLNQTYGGDLFEAEMSGVPGPSPHEENSRSKPYLETKSPGCLAFLEGFKNGGL